MAAKLSQNIRSFASSSFVNSLRSKKPDAWAPGMSVTAGKLVYYSNAKYAATTSGTTGNLPPTHTSGIQSDGGVDWVFVEPMPINNSFQGNLYLFIGKNTEWPDENNPPNPSTTDAQDYVTLNDIVSLKKITLNDIKLGVVRYNWESGTVYSQYDSSKDPFDPNAYTQPFYVITDEYNIYKCLNNNNNSPSTSKPTGTSTSVINLADGYAWKYMGSVSGQDAAGFLTSDFIPVEYKTYNDGSEQWNVQQAAKFKSISTFKILTQTGVFTTPVVSVIGVGTEASAFAVKDPITNTIRQVLITDPGHDYEPETYAIVYESGTPGSGAVVNVSSINSSGAITGVTIANPGSGYTNGAIALITGDGTGATASVTVSSGGSIQAVNITNGGSGYTSAKVWIIPGTVGAVAKAIMAPINGHGSNIVSELGASSAIISAVLNSNNPYFPVGPTSDFRQIGIITDVKDSVGDYASALYYIGPAHDEFPNVNSSLNKITPNSGYILYLSNIRSVTRSTGQEEHIKVAIVF
jgi:hypothetical protein